VKAAKYWFKDCVIVLPRTGFSSTSCAYKKFVLKNMGNSLWYDGENSFFSAEFM